MVAIQVFDATLPRLFVVNEVSDVNAISSSLECTLDLANQVRLTTIIHCQDSPGKV